MTAWEKEVLEILKECKALLEKINSGELFRNPKREDDSAQTRSSSQEH